MALLDSDLVLDDLEHEFDGRSRRTRPPVSPATAIVAAAAVGSAILHFANASARFDDYWAYGAFFVAVAWFQLAAAAGVLLRPSRGVLVAAGILNAGVALVWLLSRTVGVAIGPNATTNLSVGYPDALATAFELMVVALVVACLLVPALLRVRFSGALTVGLVAVLVVAMAAATAYAMTPRFTSSTHTTVRVVSTPASKAKPTSSSALGTGVGQAHNKSELAEQLPYIPPTPAEQATLAQQLVDARAAALRYPTYASARAAGFIPAGGFAPGSGAHMIRYRGLGDISADGSVNPSSPGSLIYAGTNPTSPVIGAMYISLGSGSAPAGFAGLNDHWHQHLNVCVKYGAGGIQVPFPADRDVTAAQCAAVGGNFMKQTVWMVHAWVVPGYESPLGVFSHDNPDVRCADGTTHADKIGFCQGT